MKRIYSFLVILFISFIAISPGLTKAEPFDDNTPPIIEIESPANESETTEKMIKVKGKVYDLESGIDKLNITGNVANIVEAEGSFLFDWFIVKTVNVVNMIAVNGAGLTTSKELTVYNKSPSDTTPPIIEIRFPEENYETKENQVHVIAAVHDPESFVTEIHITGNTANITQIGETVEFDFKLTVLDKNTVDIVATNGAGLTAKKTLTVYKRPPNIEGPKIVIELWVGKKRALIDGKTTSLDVPPQIVNGRTVVPLRFISEGFDAKVDYDTKTRSILIMFRTMEIYLEIGNNEAVINLTENGQKKLKIVMLDAPPFIQNGRTLVPVRFIAEAFGARVDWDSKTQKITITLKK